MRCLLLVVFVSLLVRNVAVNYYELKNREYTTKTYVFQFDRDTTFIFDYVYNGVGFVGKSSIFGNVLQLPDGSAKPARYLPGSTLYLIDWDCRRSSYACYRNLNIARGELVTVSHGYLDSFQIDFGTTALVSGDLPLYVNDYPVFHYDTKLVLDSSKCYTPRYTLQKMGGFKIGMSLGCFNSSYTVKAKVEMGGGIRNTIMLTPVGDGRFKTEVRGTRVMPYYIKYESLLGYAVVDIRFGSKKEDWFWLLLGFKRYLKFVNYDNVTIETVESLDSAACPVVLLIPDEFKDLYDSNCTNVTNPPRIRDFYELWDPVGVDNYHFIYSGKKTYRTYEMSVIDGRFEFYVATKELKNMTSLTDASDYYKYYFLLNDFFLYVWDSPHSNYTVYCTEGSYLGVKKEYGTWAGLNLLPVVITQDYVRVGSVFCRLQDHPNALKLLKTTTLKTSDLRAPLFVVPKKYVTGALQWDQLMLPQSQFKLIQNYHYLRSDQGTGVSTYNISTEGSLSFFFGIPGHCFKKFYIINGTLLDMDFSIYHDKHKLVFIWGKIETNITRTDLQNRLGLVMIPMTLYPEYFYIGGNFIGYNLNESYYDKMASYQVQLGGRSGSCSFMFIVPKNESKLDDSVKSGIPSEWMLPGPVEDPNEKLYWIIGGTLFSILTIVYVGLTMYFLNCCEKKEKVKVE